MPTQINDNLYLNKEDKSQIEDDANFILAQLQITAPPIPIELVIKSCLPRSEIVYPTEMPYGLKGCALRGREYSECRIFINPFYSITCQVFTKAHELKHLLENESGLKFDFDEHISPEAKFKEREADFFAACILMPEQMVKHEWDSCKNHETMARMFGVSYVAMLIKLKHIKLMPYDVAESLIERYSSFSF